MYDVAVYIAGTAGWASLRSRPILDFAGRHYFGH
jgi:hypothetical protein